MWYFCFSVVLFKVLKWTRCDHWRFYWLLNPTDKSGYLFFCKIIENVFVRAWFCDGKQTKSMQFIVALLCIYNHECNQTTKRIINKFNVFLSNTPLVITWWTALGSCYFHFQKSVNVWSYFCATILLTKCQVLRVKLLNL